jgi:hypothetical protein
MLLENVTGVVADEGIIPDVDMIICVELGMVTISIALLGELELVDSTYGGGAGALLEASTELLGETEMEDGAVSDDTGMLLSDMEAGAEDKELRLAEEVTTTTGDAGEEIIEVE